MKEERVWRLRKRFINSQRLSVPFYENKAISALVTFFIIIGFSVPAFLTIIFLSAVNILVGRIFEATGNEPIAKSALVISMNKHLYFVDW